MKTNRIKTFASAVLAAALLLSIMFALVGCGKSTDDGKTPTASESPAVSPSATPEPRPAVTALKCTHPAALSAMLPVGGARLVLSWADYEAERTTVQLVDAETDSVLNETVLEGVWDLKKQGFSDGRLALCSRETTEWLFLSSSLEKCGGMQVETVDGFFSADGESYYFLRDRVLFRLKNGTAERVALPYELRFAELSSFDAEKNTMTALFFLSPFGSDCGTAKFNVESGEFEMLSANRYSMTDSAQGSSLLMFNNESMSYSMYFGAEGGFLFADSCLFTEAGGELFAVEGAPYFISSMNGSTLVRLAPADGTVRVCALTEYGISGDLSSACFLPEAGLIAGAVYDDGGFRLYVLDPAQLEFSELAKAAQTESPIAVNAELAKAYWDEGNGAPVAENLQQAREYADELERKYGVRILLSSQCSAAVGLCKYELMLTDTMEPAEELECINTALSHLSDVLALYPQGFFGQFRNSVGDGGIRFMLIADVVNDYGVIGCAFDNVDWQNIAFTVRPGHNVDSLICHEIWHSTENKILSADYEAFPAAEWAALNPTDFEYAGSEETYDPNDMRWTLFGGAAADAHFVDSYSKVASGEDRARLMEYVMVHEEEAELMMQSPFLRKKLEIMCASMRQVFDTTGWGTPRWERLLESAA